MYTKTVDFGLSLTRFHATVELIPNVLDIVASCVFAFTYFFCLSVLLARSLSFCCFDRLTQSDLRLDNNTLEYNFEMWWILGPFFFFRRCCFHFLFTFCRNSFHFVRCVQANYSFCAVLECFFSSFISVTLCTIFIVSIHIIWFLLSEWIFGMSRESRVWHWQQSAAEDNQEQQSWAGKSCEHERDRTRHNAKKKKNEFARKRINSVLPKGEMRRHSHSLTLADNRSPRSTSNGNSFEWKFYVKTEFLILVLHFFFPFVRLNCECIVVVCCWDLKKNKRVNASGTETEIRKSVNKKENEIAKIKIAWATFVLVHSSKSTSAKKKNPNDGDDFFPFFVVNNGRAR